MYNVNVFLFSGSCLRQKNGNVYFILFIFGGCWNRFVGQLGDNVRMAENNVVIISSLIITEDILRTSPSLCVLIAVPVLS